MLKKLFCFSFILLLLSITSTTFAELAAYYSMDEGSGSLVADGSGNGHDGTITGTPTWVAGSPGNEKALKFGTEGSGVVNCGVWDTTAGTGNFTLAFWAQFATGGSQYQGVVANRNANDNQYWGLENMGANGQLYFGAAGNGGATRYGILTLPSDGTWVHVAITFNGATLVVYRDGVQVLSSATPRYGQNPLSMLRIGGSDATGNNFQGCIDEVYIFSGDILAQADIAKVMAGEMKPESNTAGLAKKPTPGNKAEGVSANVGTLSWTPGDYVAAQNGTHNVYLGTDINDVTNATLSDAEQLGVTLFAGLDSNSVDIARLKYGTTYYWRVDEVNKPASSGTTTGKIWNFSTEPEGVVLAVNNVVGVEFNSIMDVIEGQDPKTTYNGAGLNDVNGTHSNEGITMWAGAGEAPGDVWLQYELNQVYKLYQLKIWNYNDIAYKDFGAKDVNVLYSIDNVTWKALDEIQVFPMATGESNYKTDILVDMNGALAKYVKLSFLSSYFEDMVTGGISEIKFLVIPTRASSPSPANNATNVNVNSILSWKAGRDAAVHKVYISSDENSVINRNSAVLNETTDPIYPTVLDLGKTYYWRVDEVNEAEEYTIWDGPIWKFSTPQSILIDGFEIGYGNDVSKNAVFLTWKDAAELGDSSNGSYMGRKSEPYLQTINHSGGHSAPMQYDNTLKSYSEVKAETSKFAIGSDWSKGNPGALVIWFRSDSNDVNEPALDRLYVKLNDANKKIYDGPASYIRRPAWVRWEIPLTGISLDNINSITIGVERIGSTGGFGTLYLDDIMLTALSPAPVNPGTDGLLAKYAMENNVLDTSGSGLDGTLVGTANGGLTFVDGLAGYGKALVFDGNDDCVDLGNKPEFNPAGSFSVSIWAKINTWSSQWGHVMVGNRGEGTVGWQIRRYSNSTLCFTTRGVGTNQDDTNSNATPGLNVWTNITCVYDSEAHTKSIYIDGVLDKTVNLTGTNYVVGATTHNTYIGARANSANAAQEGFFKGSLDQILIYNRALSAGEAAFLADPTP